MSEERCALKNEEGFCTFEGDCSYRSSDRTCQIPSEVPLMTHTEYKSWRRCTINLELQFWLGWSVIILTWKYLTGTWFHLTITDLPILLIFTISFAEHFLWMKQRRSYYE